MFTIKKSKESINDKFNICLFLDQKNIWHMEFKDDQGSHGEIKGEFQNVLKYIPDY